MNFHCDRQKSCFILLIFCLLFAATRETNGQWTQTNGPYGGRIFKLIHSGGETYAVHNYSSIYRSLNNGDSWTYHRQGSDIVVTGIHSFVISGNSIMHSDDDGLTWNSVSAGISGGAEYLGVIDTIVFAMKLGQVYKSSNYGSSWILINTGLPFIYPSTIISMGSAWYLGTDGGVYKSVNGGSSWTSTGLGLAWNITSLITDGVNLYAGTTNGGGVQVSTNGGNSWTAANTGLTNLTIKSLLFTGSSLFAATPNGVFLSVNNGNTWTAASSGLQNPFVESLGFNGAAIFAGTNGTGVFKSVNNGASWIHSSDSLVYSPTEAIIEHNGILFAGVSEGGGVYKSLDNGNTWIPANGEVKLKNVYTLLSYGNKIYAGTFYNVYVSDDDGNTWNNIGINSSVHDLIVHNDTILACSYIGLFLSVDSGATWQMKNNGITNTSLVEVTTIGSSIFVGTNGSPGGGVFRSDDNANSWINVNDSISHVFDLVSSGDTLYLAGSISGGLYVSTDLGNNWTTLVPNIYSVYSVQVNNHILYSGFNGNIYTTHDFGNTWFKANIPDFYYATKDWLIRNGNVFAATTHGVYVNSNLLCSSFESISPASCGSYISPSGNYTWDSSGVYVDTLINAAGCDSLIAINLTITSFNSTLTYSGPTSFCRGDSIWLNTSATYSSWQWYRNDVPIAIGGSGPGYFAKTKGSYYCVVSDSMGCIDTTNSVFINVPCIPVGPNHQKTTDMNDDSMQLEILQTTSGGTFNLTLTPGLLSIYNLTGQLVYQKHIYTPQTELDLPLWNGLYIFTLQSGSNHISRKIHINSF